MEIVTKFWRMKKIAGESFLVSFWLLFWLRWSPPSSAALRLDSAKRKPPNGRAKVADEHQKFFFNKNEGIVTVYPSLFDRAPPPVSHT
jgi:hypothetical protein